MRYPLHFSRMVAGITLVVVALGLCTLYFLGQEAYQSDNGWLWALFALLGLVFLLPFLLMPRYVEEDEEGLRLRLLVCSLHYRKSEGYELQLRERLPNSGRIRLLASGGYFGFLGLFYSTQVGAYWLFLTNEKAPCYEVYRKGKLRAIIGKG